MKGSFIKVILLSASGIYGLLLATSTFAIPTLQVGAPAGSGDSGTYADYIASSPDPDETDTAITYGDSLIFAGNYGSGTNLPHQIGGKYSTGKDWSEISYGKVNGVDQYFTSDFNGAGAVVMVSTIGTGTGTLMIGGASAIYTSFTSFFPNNHAPINTVADTFMFFDIGNFAKNAAGVVNLDESEGASTGTGEMKTKTITGTGGFDWLHFDLLAIETDTTGSKLKTTLENNPGSHDVTWKQEVPEPAPLALLGMGMLAVFLSTRRRKA